MPRRVEITASGGLAVEWSDGHLSTVPARALRLACKCANCEDEWTAEPRLDPRALPDDLCLVESRPVGRYGLQLAFSDGHNTGIYTFDRLRALCTCPGCRAAAGR